MPTDRPLEPGSAMSHRDRAPSATAQARLSGALRDRADAYRQDASLDLTMVEALLRMDEPEAAARTIDGHRQALLAMARDLQEVVADAAVEREAEAVCSAVQRGMGRQAPPVGGLRRRVLTMAGAAAVVVALILPQARLSPRTTLTSVQGDSSHSDVAAALERLEAAKTWARALRAGNAELAAVAADAPRPRAAGRAAVAGATGLAADLPGESAADASAGAEIIDLEAYRSTRGGGEAMTSQPPAGGPEEPALTDLPAPQTQLPSSGVPLSLDVELDPELAPEPPPGDIPPLP